MTSKSKITNLLKGKSVPNLPSYSSPWTKQDKELMKAVESMDVKKVGTLLLKKSIITTKLGPNGKSVFHCACEVGNKQILDIILSKTQDVNDSTCQGVTALHIAAAQGHAYTVDKLLKFQASVDKKDSNKMTALHHACAGQHLECVKTLLMAKADPQAVDQGGRTPLHYAAHKGGPYSVTICQWLLEKGAQISWQDRDKTTSLMLAAREGHIDVCTYLLGHGAAAELKDKTGLTALEQALKRGHTSLQEIFERAPVKVFENVSEQGSYTPSESGSASHDQADGMSPVFRTRSGGYTRGAAVSSSDNESFSRTDVHSLHSFHSMDDELLTHHQIRKSSQPFLTNFSSNLEETYNELKSDHEKLNLDFKNISLENNHLREKLESLQLKMAEYEHTEQNMKLTEPSLQVVNEDKMRKLEDQVSLERIKVEELEKKLEMKERQAKKESQDVWIQCDKEMNNTKLNHENNTLTDDHMLAKLKTQILALKQENDHLKFTKVDGLIEETSSDQLHYEASLFVAEKKKLQAHIDNLEEEKQKLELIQNADTEELLRQNSMMSAEIEVLRQEVTSLRESLPTESQRLDALINQNFEEVNFDEEGFVDGRDMTKEEFLQAQNHQLKAQCHLLTDELIKLRTTFDAILKAGDNLQADYDQLAAEKDAIQDDLEAAIAEKQNIIAENDYLINDTNVLHDNLNKIVHELEKMQEKYQAAQAECEDLKRSVAVASKVGEVSRLLEERDALREKCADMQTTLDRLQHDHTILLEEVQSLTDEVNNLNLEKEQLITDYNDICQQLETTQNDFGQLEIDFGVLLREKEKLEGQGVKEKLDGQHIEKHSESTQTEEVWSPSWTEHEKLQASFEVDESMSEAHPVDLSQVLIDVKNIPNEKGNKEREIVEENLKSDVDRETIDQLQEELSDLGVNYAKLCLEKEKLEEKLQLSELNYQQLQLNDLKHNDNVQVKHLQAELQTMKDSFEAVLKEKEILEVKLDEARQRQGQDAEKLLQLEADLDDLIREKEAHGSQATEEMQMREVDLTKVQQLEDEFAELLREKEALEARHGADIEKMRTLKIDYRKVLHDKSVLEEKFQSAQLRLQELERSAIHWTDSKDNDFKKLKTEFQELLAEKEELENVIHGLSRHNVTIEKKMKSLQNSLTEYQTGVGPVAHQEEMRKHQEEIISLKKQIVKLTAECAEWEKKHADTVSTYRTHLLSAVQGHIDPDVKDALHHIIEIRSMEQLC